MEQSQSSQAERRRLISGGRKLRPRGHIWFGDVGHKGYSVCVQQSWQVKRTGAGTVSSPHPHTPPSPSVSFCVTWLKYFLPSFV